MFEQIGTLDWMYIVLVGLLAISEIMPFTEKVKANGIFQGVLNLLKVAVSALKKK